MPRVARSTTRRPARRSNMRIPARARPRVLRGRGGYWDNLKKRWGEGGGSMKGAFQAAGSAGGSALGGAPGGAIGGLLGGLLNRALYAVTGFGDYKIRSNILMDESNGPPIVKNRGKEFIVRHREFIQDIYTGISTTANAPSPFAIQGYSIQPGNFNTFPWLSSIADKFEQYRVEGMIFEYKSMFSDAVVTTNGALGSVILATEYNANAPAFTNKQAMENYEFAQSAKPSQSVLHPIECARQQSVLSELYIRVGSLPTGEDLKTYDFGTFYIATVGVPLGPANTGVNLGELWISYQLSLIKPRIQTSNTTYIDSGFAYFSGGPADPLPGQGNPNYNPWGTIPVPFSKVSKRSGSNIPITLLPNNTFNITCLSVPMVYQFNAQWYSFNAAISAVWRGPATVLTNCTYVNSTASGSFQNVRTPAALQASNACTTQFFIRVPAYAPGAPIAVVDINTSTFGCDQGTDVRFELMINAVPPSISQ